jgi:hypothetical protein
MKVLAVAVLAVVVSVVTVLGGAAWQAGAWPSGPDAVGFGLATGVAGAVVVGALYWPVLAWLRRRGGTLRPLATAGLTAAGLNAPVYAVLAIAGNDRNLFAANEAFLIGMAFALMGIGFGAGYAWTHRGAGS